MTATVIMHVVSTAILIALGVGLAFRRRNPRVHLRIMTACFVADLALVLWIELSRGAVETVVTQAHPIVWVHALISTGVLLCYLVMLNLGWRMTHGRAALRRTHKRMGITFCVLRLLNYATAFVVSTIVVH
jgi:hypothetical protein